MNIFISISQVFYIMRNHFIQEQESPSCECNHLNIELPLNITPL